MGERRVADVVVADHGRDAGRGGRRGHLLGLGEGQPERLLAIDVLAGGDRGEGHLAVEAVRRGDRDDVDRGIVDERTPVVGRPREAELVRHRLGARGRGVAEQRETRRRDVAEHPTDRAEGERVALSHEARADQSDAVVVAFSTP